MKVYLLLTCLFHSLLTCLFHSPPSSHDIQATSCSELVPETNTTESPNRTITSHASCTNPRGSVIKPTIQVPPNIGSTVSYRGDTRQYTIHTYTNRYGRTPYETKTKNTMSLDYRSISYIGTGIRRVALKEIYYPWVWNRTYLQVVAMLWRLPWGLSGIFPCRNYCSNYRGNGTFGVTALFELSHSHTISYRKLFLSHSHYR